MRASRPLPTPDRPGAPSRNGFTLIEMMVVVAIVAILATVAYPAYTGYVLRGHRTEAQAVLVEGVQFMERNFTLFNTYEAVDLGTTPPTLSNNTLPSTLTNRVADRYTVTISAQNATSFTLQAAPTSVQSGDSCGMMTITHTGAKSPGQCW